MSRLSFEQFLAQTDYDNDGVSVDITTLTDAEALALVNAYTETKLWRIEGAERKTQVETAVVMNGTRERLQAQLVDVNTPAQLLPLIRAIDAALGQFYQPEFYINLNDPVVKGMFDQAAATSTLNSSETSAITEAATYVETLFTNKTLYDVKNVRNNCPTVGVTHANDYVVINVTADCERHNPALYGFNSRTEQWQRIGNFSAVELSGKYDLRIAREWRTAQLRVDDAYGVIEAV
mgnify:FL=1